MEWDDELLELFDIPKPMMPKVLACDEDFGTISINGNNIPIRGVIGDQQAALVGQGCFSNGDMKSTYGTGCFLMVNTEDNPVSIKEGLLTTIAYKLEGRVHYAIEGSIYSCGNIIKWLRDKMKFFNSAIESESFIDKEGNSNNVLFLPKSIISFLKKNITANKEPTWALMFISNSSSLKPNKFDSKLRWADELTGRNSVIP